MEPKRQQRSDTKRWRRLAHLWPSFPSSYEVLTHDNSRPKANQTQCSTTDAIWWPVESGQKTANRTLLSASLFHFSLSVSCVSLFQLSLNCSSSIYYLALFRVCFPWSKWSGMAWRMTIRQINSLRTLSHFSLDYCNAGLLKNFCFTTFCATVRIFFFFNQSFYTLTQHSLSAIAAIIFSTRLNWQIQFL